MSWESILTLSGLEDEGNAVPTLVLDVCDQRAEGGTARILGHGVVLEVTGLAAVEGAAVLADDDILGLDGIHSAENTDLLVTDVLGREGDGTLHSEQCEDLQKVCKLLAWSYFVNATLNVRFCMTSRIIPNSSK
jgi:hypothetical protein